MKIENKLNKQLLSQSFEAEDITDEINRYKAIAAGYAFVENAIAVLSDMKEDRSYIYYGGIAETLRLGKGGTSETIDSIWEKKLFALVPEHDMERKTLDELQFFHFIKSVPKQKRSAYVMQSCLSMNAASGVVAVMHRITYLHTKSPDSVRFALCLYNIVPAYVAETYVVNTVDGSRTALDRHKGKPILSEREIEVLRLIEDGKSSQEIADKAFISIHTVSRHRQNIMMKLRVKNTTEACKMARLLDLL